MPLEAAIGAVIAGNVNNATPAKPTMDNVKPKLLGFLPMITLPWLGSWTMSASMKFEQRSRFDPHQLLHKRGEIKLAARPLRTTQPPRMWGNEGLARSDAAAAWARFHGQSWLRSEHRHFVRLVAGLFFPANTMARPADAKEATVIAQMI
jgi:hypothetical protein